ncbi:MAG: hypothetical protein IJ812_07660 [Schwartzia sp.]|nr:hypothetical protein [Schwartzia sp. (in: firmicutes)]MBR1886270.1 hypothetical protein [Schwartzia sp. (in: firmicutes)]
MKNKILAGVLSGLFVMCAGISMAECTRLDTYKHILQNKKFTIRYSIITPQSRRISQHTMIVYEGELLSSTPDVVNRQYTGTIVSDGDNRYTEVCYGGKKHISQQGEETAIKETDEEAVCMLIKEKEKFCFSRQTTKGKSEYYGVMGKGKVVADLAYEDPYTVLLKEMDYGNSDISPLLAAILPPDQKFALKFTPNYQFQDTGELDNGLAYEDYVSNIEDRFDAIRYYFDGDKLVKIASASYKKKPDGSIEGFNRCVAKITEFAPMPEQALLSLPEGLKDMTKRDKKAKDSNKS